MSRTEKNKVKKQRPKQKPVSSAGQAGRVKPKTGVLAEQMDSIQNRSTMAVSIAGVVGAAAFMLFFFTSDIGDKIIQAKSEPVYAAQVNQPTGAGASDKSLHIAVLPGDGVSKESVIRYLESLSDEEFDTLLTAVSEHGKPEDLPANQAGSRLYASILEGDVTDREAILSELERMDSSEFNAFIESVVASVSPNQLANLRQNLTQPQDAGGEGMETADDGGRVQPTLEDAYAEAERLYPGQIDGSKRLKLVADLNASEYLYYVAEQGDTLIRLSEAFSVPLGQLVELNGIHDADKINAGSILLFPADTKQPDLD